MWVVWSSPDARGDQCDACGEILEPSQLKNPKCKLCESVPEERETENFYLKLSAFQKDLEKFVKKSSGWRKNALKITKYAGRLLKDLDKLDWPEKIKNAQEKWIGESVGHTVVFECSSDKTLPSISTFTTRVETLPGVTFLSIAPDSQYTEKIIENSKNKKEIEDYIFECSKKTNDQTKEKEKSGHVVEGVSYTNPLNKKEVPIVVSDYVLSSYGTGAVMGVPGHDERDKGAAELFFFSYC